MSILATTAAAIMVALSASSRMWNEFSVEIARNCQIILLPVFTLMPWLSLASVLDGAEIVYGGEVVLFGTMNKE